MHVLPQEGRVVISINRLFSSCALVVVAMLVALSALAAESLADVDRRWLDRLDSSDREPLNRLIGQAPPAFEENLRWHNAKEGIDWQSLREKVVVIQSWTSSTEAGRRWVARTSEIVSRFSETDVAMIALHTPDGEENASTFVERRGIEIPVAVDPTGKFCDALGVYRRPVNIIIDRHGAVRYAGLSADGLTAALNRLVDEMYDPSRCPEPHNESSKEFPTFTNSVGTARDIRGQSAPELKVEHWVTEQPATDDKVVLVVFWATWCGPCINTMPHLNTLAERFGEDVVIIGVSNEQLEQFQSGMRRRNLSADRFSYAVGCDPRGSMQSAIAVRGIPHAIAMSSDWVVRWQGHPGTLSADMLGQIVSADRGDAERPKGRWLATR